MKGIVLAVIAAGCARLVRQDAATGSDGRIEGAAVMAWISAERAGARGAVTYPGGDRVDWHVVRLPDTRADVAIELRWEPDRPKSRLRFDVFGDGHELVARAFAVGPQQRRVELTDVRGELFIRVYAVARGDAATYELTVTRDERPVVDWSRLEVVGPPELPEVPFVCTDATFDKKRPECMKFCNGDPAWAGCPPPRCPTPPDVELPECQRTMPCPTPPDRRVKACLPVRTCTKPGEPYERDLRPCPPPDRVHAKIIGVELQGQEAIVRVGAGTNDHVDRKMRVVVVRGRDGVPVPGGDARIVRVDKVMTVIVTKLTPDQLKTSGWVRFE